MFCQEERGEEGERGPEIHGELEGGEMGACQEGQEAEEAGDFVNDLEIGYYFGAGAEGEDVKECLRRKQVSHGELRREGVVACV